MKTQVLQLEPHDDAISTCDKLGWSQTGRILLVWPRKGRVLTRRLDLVLLQRHSQHLGAQLALVTRDPEVRRHAREISIPVFKNPKQAQIKRWRTPRRPRWELPEKRTNREELEKLQNLAHPKPKRWLTHPLTRLLLFLAGVLAVFAIAAVLLPGARIELTPEITTQRLTLDVRVSEAIDTFNISGILPVRTVEILVEGRDSLPTTGRTQAPFEPASGEVLFTNLTPATFTIPAGTIISTTGETPVRFATLQAVEMPAGPGESASISVEALEAGPLGNLSAESLIAIEGPLGLSLTVNNPEPTAGGSLQALPIPSQADRRQLYDRLLFTLEQTARDEFAARYPIQNLSGGDLVLSQTPQLVQTLEARYTPENDEVSETLELTLRLEYAFELVSQDDIQAFAQAVLDANLPPGFAPLAGSLQIKHAGVPEPDEEGEYQWSMTIERRIQALLDVQSIINLVLGLPVEDALQRLEQGVVSASPPRLMIAPDWWPRLPFLPFRIDVSLDPSL
jgi:hypothetical protein